MLRIAIYHQHPDTVRRLHQVVQAVSDKLRLACQISVFHHLDAALQGIRAAGYFHVLLLEAAENGLEMGALLRKTDLHASILLIGPAQAPLNQCLCCRPSALADPADLKETVLALRHCLAEQQRRRQYFSITCKEAAFRVPFEEITFVESNQRTLLMHTRKRVIRFYGKLNDLQSALPENTFLRCHQSYLINMGAAEYLDKTRRCFILGNGDSVEISKSHYADVAAQFESFISR